MWTAVSGPDTEGKKEVCPSLGRRVSGQEGSILCSRAYFRGADSSSQACPPCSLSGHSSVCQTPR